MGLFQLTQESGYGRWQAKKLVLPIVNIRADGLRPQLPLEEFSSWCWFARACWGLQVVSADSLYNTQDPISSLSQEQKVALLQLRVSEPLELLIQESKDQCANRPANHSIMLVMASDGTFKP